MTVKTSQLFDRTLTRSWSTACGRRSQHASDRNSVVGLEVECRKKLRMESQTCPRKDVGGVKVLVQGPSDLPKAGGTPGKLRKAAEISGSGTFEPHVQLLTFADTRTS
jgi:hypothetical protein